MPWTRLRFIHDGNLRRIRNCARQGLCTRSQARPQAHAHGVQERSAWSCTRLRYACDVIAALFMEFLHVIRPQTAASGASAWVDHAARTARLPNSAATCSRNRKAGSSENAKSRCPKSPRFRIPFQLRCSSGLRIVVARASAKEFPPEAGAFSGERRQRDVEVGCGALGELCHRPRPIEPQHQNVVEKLEAICVMLFHYCPKFRKISLHCALSIFNRDVKAYHLAKRAE
jgi:hypothetical protein